MRRSDKALAADAQKYKRKWPIAVGHPAECLDFETRDVRLYGPDFGEMCEELLLLRRAMRGIRDAAAKQDADLAERRRKACAFAIEAGRQPIDDPVVQRLSDELNGSRPLREALEVGTSLLLRGGYRLDRGDE